MKQKPKLLSLHKQLNNGFKRQRYYSIKLFFQCFVPISKFPYRKTQSVDIQNHIFNKLEILVPHEIIPSLMFFINWRIILRYEKVLVMSITCLIIRQIIAFTIYEFTCSSAFRLFLSLFFTFLFLINCQKLNPKMVSVTLRTNNNNLVCGVLRDLILCAQFKKREKHPWRSVTFSKFGG